MGNAQSSGRVADSLAKGIGKLLDSYRNFSTEVKPYGLKVLHDPDAAVVE
jgi:hypothetical protein